MRSAGIASIRRGAGAVLLAAALTACSAGGRYYVKADLSPEGIQGVTALTRAAVPMAPFELGVTFKSDGKVLTPAGDQLYRLVHDDLGRRGGWSVRRIGRPGQDFAPQLAAIAAAAAAPPQPGRTPRMLMLVEDRTDRSDATRMDYLLSGMSVGLYGVRKAVDRYDVSIAYCGADGVQHLYRSRQELLYGNGAGSGDTDAVPPELKRYDNPLAAFDQVVYAAVSGSRHGVVSVGQPQLVQPAAAAAAAAH